MFMVDKLVDVDENNQPAMRACGTRFCKGFWAVPPAMYSYTRADSMVRPYGICRDVIKHKAPALLATQQRGRHKIHNHCSLQDLLSLWQSGVYRCLVGCLQVHTHGPEDLSSHRRLLAGASAPSRTRKGHNLCIVLRVKVGKTFLISPGSLANISIITNKIMFRMRRFLIYYIMIIILYYNKNLNEGQKVQILLIKFIISFSFLDRRHSNF